MYLGGVQGKQQLKVSPANSHHQIVVTIVCTALRKQIQTLEKSSAALEFQHTPFCSWSRDFKLWSSLAPPISSVFERERVT